MGIVFLVFVPVRVRVSRCRPSRGIHFPGKHPRGMYSKSLVYHIALNWACWPKGQIFHSNSCKGGQEKIWTLNPTRFQFPPVHFSGPPPCDFKWNLPTRWFLIFLISAEIFNSTVGETIEYIILVSSQNNSYSCHPYIYHWTKIYIHCVLQIPCWW